MQASRREEDSIGRAFIKNGVVGLGLYQGVEFVPESTAWELLGKAGQALSRLGNSVSVIRRSRVYRLSMGPDIQQTQEVLIRFLLQYARRSTGTNKNAWRRET